MFRMNFHTKIKNILYKTSKISNPTRIIMVLVGLYFFEAKVAGVHGGHEVVEKAIGFWKIIFIWDEYEVVM